MAINKLDLFVEDSLISKLFKHYEDQAGPEESLNDVTASLLTSALDYIASGLTPAPVTGTVFAPSKLPLSDTTLAQVADLAASSGIDFDLCLAHVVAEGLNFFNQKQAETNELIDQEGSAAVAQPETVPVL